MARFDSSAAALAGVGLGAGLIYLLDPHSGRRRRRLVADQFVSVAGHADDAVSTAARDMAHRARGLVHETGRRLRPERPVDDRVLEERVRARLGRYVSHPHAIAVVAEDGLITLCGPILAHEVDRLVRAVGRIPGVAGVANELEEHKTRDGVPALQGGETPPGEPLEFRQENWSPAPRLLASALGGGMALYGTTRRDGFGAVMAAAGMGVLLRAVTNLPARRLTGIGAGRLAVELHKNIHLDLPPETVFQAWSDYANFPRFMSHVREVRDAGNRRSHWEADGPAGTTIHWEAVLTRYEPPALLAWKTDEGSPFPNAGIIHFTAAPQGGTDVDIRLSYNPPGGALGHAAAVLLGSSPRRRMNDDLLRMKTFLETGRPPHDAAQPGPVSEPAPVGVPIA
jgi:uncharacterized membrane protein